MTKDRHIMAKQRDTSHGEYHDPDEARKTGTSESDVMFFGWANLLKMLFTVRIGFLVRITARSCGC